MKIISVTGTKGKTFLVLLLDNIIRSLGRKTICINSNGLFFKGKKIKSNDYFIKKYETSSNVVGLRELNEKMLKGIDYLILESSFSSGNSFNKTLVKNKIDIAVLTNVYWDHIDGKDIKNQYDLLIKKIQILKNTKKGGKVFIFVGDRKDSISYKAIKILEKERPDLEIIVYDKNPISILRKYARLYLKKNYIYLNNERLLNYDKVPLIFKKFSPAIDLISVVLGGILKYIGINPEKIYNIKNTKNLIRGRLNLFEKNGYSVMLDYSHEIKSIKASSELIHRYFKMPINIAVIRFSYYRSDKYIKELTKNISSLFDRFVVYDKAISRKNLRDIFIRKYSRKAGDVAKLMNKSLKDNNKEAIIINDELDAIKRTVKKLKKNEFLYVMGDQIGKDINVINTELNKK
jgi:UDP-N-acetylmuramate-alanine ligase